MKNIILIITALFFFSAQIAASPCGGKCLDHKEILKIQTGCDDCPSPCEGVEGGGNNKASKCEMSYCVDFHLKVSEASIKSLENEKTLYPNATTETFNFNFRPLLKYVEVLKVFSPPLPKIPIYLSLNRLILYV